MNKLLNGPDFLVLGIAKAGTTTLFDLLNSITGFYGSSPKELRFFSMDYFYKKGLQWYHSNFNGEPNSLKFEATPHYLYFTHVPERVYNYTKLIKKDLKFIVLLRDPTSRAYAAWNMERSYHQHQAKKIIEEHYKYYNPDIRESLTELLLRKEFPSFQTAVQDDLERFHNKIQILEPSYVRKGLYAEQILRWLKWFGFKQFLFIEFRELTNPAQVIHKILSFLNVKNDVASNQIQSLHSNKGEYLSPSEEDTKVIEILKEFYNPYNETLFKIIEKRYDWND